MVAEVSAVKLDLVPDLLEEVVLLCLGCIEYFDGETFEVKRFEKTAAAAIVVVMLPALTFADLAGLYADYHLDAAIHFAVGVGLLSEQASSWAVAA